MTIDVVSELQGTVVALLARPGEAVRFGGVLALVESMKMHHEVVAPADGMVASIVVVEAQRLQS
jgi:Acetyl/propionyl-CoA carboxylase, alpha subunit